MSIDLLNNSVGLCQNDLVYMGHLHFVLPALNITILEAAILIWISVGLRLEICFYNFLCVGIHYKKKSYQRLTSVICGGDLT